jgi:hypothetical protein
LQSFLSYFSWKKTPIKEFPKKKVPETQAPTEPPKVLIKPLKEIDANLLTKASNELAQVIGKRKQLDQVVVDLVFNINQTAEHYPGDKTKIINYLRHFLKQEDIIVSWNNIELLKNEFIALDDADIVRSLCTHFSAEKGEYTHGSLLQLLSSNTYTELDKEDKKLFLTLLTNLINNDKACTIDELKELMNLSRKNPTVLKTLKEIYQSAPYPTLKDFNEWVASCPKDHDLATHLADCYSKFDKEPCAREAVNGFNLEFAREQANKMGGVKYSDQELQDIDKAVQEVSKLSTEEIKKELLALRASPSEKRITTERLVALSAELLYRTKGMPAEFFDGKQKLGRSFEIHTTQYLAIHSMLKSGKHVTSEIGTGEGKSRIMMLMVMCQYAQGKTVDFVTSDVQLATRDYLSFRAFFQALGAKTNLIYQNTPASEYAIDGINFSDAANLSLFRNKARSEGQSDLVIAKDPKNRALTLDEADKTYFDMADKRFNYSALADESIRDMPWAYEVLVGFFSQNNPEIKELYYKDIDACNKELIRYAYSQVPEKASQLESISQAQLEAWQQSAVTALGLELDKDFIIKPNVEIETSQGPKIVSQVNLLIGTRADPFSKYSFGTHQCLEARLNLLKRKQPENLSSDQDKKLFEALKDNKNDFYIDDEKQIVYSSTSKSLLDEYKEGTIYAVTGTIGSIEEQEEVESSYITIPRHKGLNRVDYPLYLTPDKMASNEFIVQEIKEARANKQPVAIVCANDIESQAMFDYLQKIFPNDPANPSLVRISSQTSAQDEAKHIEERAGTPGMITVSTGMIGRGTDIPLHGEALNKGLKVRVNYLPRERELLQILGRAGRFGAEGDTRLVLNKVDLKKQFGKASLNDGFYTATEAYLKQQHAIMDRKAQVARIIKFTVADFRQKLTKNYF